MSDSVSSPLHDGTTFFLRRAFPGPRDLWTELVDWAPTILTAVAVVLSPYLLVRMLELQRPPLTALHLLVSRDRIVRTAGAFALALSAALGLFQAFQLLLERRRRVVRLDLHEIECWPERRLRFLLVRDVVGAQAGSNQRRSRWWVLRSPRQALVLFVKRPGEDTIEHVRVEWSRHDLIAPGGLAPGAVDGGGSRDGNALASDAIALLRRRRVALGLPIEELPATELDVTAESGVRLIGGRDGVELTLGDRTMAIPGWAVRSAAVLAAPAGSRAPLQLALELDPRCGEFHLVIPLGKGPGDEKIVEWCQLLAARFDKIAG